MRRRRTLLYIIAIGATLLFNSCSDSLPGQYVENSKEAPIYPDYSHLVIPANIAPLNFRLDEAADKVVARLTAGEEELIVTSGKDLELSFPAKQWKRLLEKANGRGITYDLYAEKGGKWEHYKPFTNNVSTDSIDPYLTYRLIEPSYMGSGEMGIYQFNLEEGEEEAIFTNHHDHIKGNNQQQKCMNCHTAQRNHPENKMFYYRGPNGGLLLTYNGKIRKINTRCGDMTNPTIYPAWHPSKPLIAFSSNKVLQRFCSNDNCKIDVFDDNSDLVLYDIEKNEISPIRKTPEQQESNPCWSSNGEYLYFNSTDSCYQKSMNPRNLLYNIYRVRYKGATEWGENEMVYEAAKERRSATYPKASPDGKFLLITVSSFGPSTQTNKSADLYMIDLNGNKVRSLDEVNSATESDSYHDWTSNSRWIVFCSRREDGNYARPYFSHISDDGKASKPFVLPRNDSRYHEKLIKNYNVTEFSKAPVTTSVHNIQATLERAEIQATYNGPTVRGVTDGQTGATNPTKRTE